jgi:hypothetical protein
MIIAAMANMYHKQSHKFGTKVPKGLDEAVELNEENINMLWQDATRKEMNNVRIVFNILNDDGPSLQPIKRYDLTCYLM